MPEPILRRLDFTATVLLLLWVGAAVGIGLLAVPQMFTLLPNREWAATVGGSLVVRGDVLAFFAFGFALALVTIPRWLDHIDDPVPIGPYKLWIAAALLALLMSFASLTVVTPRIMELRAKHQNQSMSLSLDHPDRKAIRKAHAISSQFFVIRLLLGLGLALGISRLPMKRREPQADKMASS